MAGTAPIAGETSLYKIVASVRELFQGRSHATGQFTCTLNQATTVVTAPNCGASSVVKFTPRHANAAAEVGSGTIFVSAVTQGAFTVTHNNSAVADRTFDYALQG